MSTIIVFMPEPTSHQFRGFDDWVEVFRGGEQTDSSGHKRVFTQAELDSVVANHSAAHPAPAVIGHPKHDAPAYGWTDQVRRVGDVLQAKFKQVEPQFAKLVEDGRFRNRSVKLLAAPGGFKLDHVGFLGAAPPAIEGLNPMAYAKVEDGGATYEFTFRDARRSGMLARVFRSLKNAWIEASGAESAETAISEDTIAELESMAIDDRVDAEVELYTPDPAVPSTAYTAARGGQTDPAKEATTVSDPNDKTFTQADIDAAVKAAEDKAASEYSQLSDKHEALTYTQRLSEHKATIDTALNAGRLTPAQAQGCAEFMAALPAGDEATFEFSAAPAKEGEQGEQIKRDPAKWFAEFVAKLPVQVPINRRLDGEDAPINPGSDARAIERAAHEYQAAEKAKGITVGYRAAVNHVTKHTGDQA